MKKVYVLMIAFFMILCLGERIMADDVKYCANSNDIICDNIEVDNISGVGDIIIYEGVLPPAVRASYEKVCIATIKFTIKNKKNNETGYEYYAGTCIPIGNGKVITSYHLKGRLIESVEDLNKRGSDFEIKNIEAVIVFLLKNGVFYNDANGTAINIPAKIYHEEKEEDWMILQANIDAFENFLDNVQDGVFKIQAIRIFSYLKSGIELEENAEVGERVYLVAFSTFPKDRYFQKSDLLPHVFSGRLKFKNGLYHLILNSEPGYSGGALLNKDGKVLGFHVMSSLGRNFSAAIPIKKINNIIKK